VSDDIDMAPAATAGEMRGLARHGEQLATDWRSTKSAIAGSEGGIGGDLLGQAFRGLYLADSAAVREAADRVPDSIMTDASLGHHATSDYVGSDGGAGEGFGRIG
jgi:hypothetical protein